MLLYPAIHRDERGLFLEITRAAHLPVALVQANHSRSAAGVLRGIHYHGRQWDVWYVVRGACQVALADLRGLGGRPTVRSLELGDDDPSVLVIPPGVAHGLLALSDLDLLYCVSSYYDGSDEFSVSWRDPALAIPWKTDTPALSQRDSAAAAFDWNDVARALGGEG